MQEVIDRWRGLARQVDLLFEAEPLAVRGREEAVQLVERGRPDPEGSTPGPGEGADWPIPWRRNLAAVWIAQATGILAT